MRRILTFQLLAILAISSLWGITANAQSHTLFFGTSFKQVPEGNRVSIDVKINSSSQSINAISGAVTFSESLIRVVSVSRDKSIINFWTKEPSVQRNKILFEGIILNPGFKGNNGTLFSITFEAKHAGTAILGFSEGAILANDGLGTNILATFGSATLRIVPGNNFNQTTITTGDIEPSKPLALPVITDYSSLVNSKDGLYIKGKGEPDTLTKIVFKDVSVKSLGEQLIAYLQTDKKKLDEVLVNNNTSGEFQYVSPKNIIAGVYNATPFLVDNNTNTERPGFGVQLLVNDSEIVKILVLVLSILGLLIPIVGLGVIIYFIPWYSWRRMRVLKKKLGLEEEKIVLSGHQLERQDRAIDQNIV